MPTLYIERALFVVGEQNSGKSKQLRSIFQDCRLYGKMPEHNRTAETFNISNNRSLYIRLTSPHEKNESLDQFHRKVVAKTQNGRWCIAAPLQPFASNKMPDVDECILKFVDRFSPERVRVCFIYPDNAVPNSGQIGNVKSVDLVEKLWRIPNVECVYIDARDKTKNGFFLSDFFDFT